MLRYFLTLFSALLFVSAASAQSLLYSLGHGDLRITYSDGVLAVDYRLDAGARVGGQPTYNFNGETIWSASDLVTFIPDVTLPRPPGPEWDFLGNAESEPLWYIPEVQEDDRPWLGTSSETLNLADWTSVKIRLTGMTGPAGGHFSFFDSSVSFGGSPIFATADGITAADEYETNVGSHAHFNWLFTKRGLYSLTFLITGQHVSDGTKTATATIHIEIGQKPSITLVETGATLPLDIGDVTVKSLGPADVDDGLYYRSAFRLGFSGSGVTAANDSGLVVAQYNTFSLRVREGTTLADDTRVKFASFGDPVVDDFDALTYTVGLTGRVSKGNDEALARTDANSGTMILAREGFPSAGLTGWKYGRIKWFHAAPNGVLTFCATAKRGTSARTGIWRSIRGGAARLLVATGLPMSEGGKVVTLISLPTLNGSARDQSRAVGATGLLTLRLSYRGGAHSLVVFPSPLP